MGISILLPNNKGLGDLPKAIDVLYFTLNPNE